MSRLNLTKVAGIMFLVCFSDFSFAGHDVGNGGDGVVCSGPEKTHVLLDLHEWDYLDRDFTPIAVSGESVTAIAEDRISFLKILDPIRYEKFGQIIKKFADKRDVNWSENLRVLQDSGLTVELPSNCQLVQAAIHIPTGSEFKDISLLMNRSLWQAMDIRSQAALLIHEAVYREASILGQTDSFNVRSFVRVLFSQQIESMSAGQYYNVLRKLMLPSTANSEKLRSIVNFVSRHLLKPTLTGIVLDERLGNNRIRTVQIRRNFGTARAYGNEVEFEESQTVKELIWDFDVLQNKRTNLRTFKYSTLLVYRFTQMKQSGEVLFSIYPKLDTRQDDRARVESGRVLSVDDSSLVIGYETDQYAEMVDQSGEQFAGVVVTQETFIPKGISSSVEIKTDRKIYKLNDIQNPTSRELLRTESVLSR